MPEYQYQCSTCNNKFSIFISIKNKPKDEEIFCPLCHKKGIVKRIFEKFSFVLNGKDFYSTTNKVKEGHDQK